MIALLLSLAIFVLNLFYEVHFVGPVSVEPDLSDEQFFHLRMSSWIAVGNIALFLSAILLLIIAAVRRVSKVPPESAV